MKISKFVLALITLLGINQFAHAEKDFENFFCIKGFFMDNNGHSQDVSDHNRFFLKAEDKLASSGRLFENPKKYPAMFGGEVTEYRNGQHSRIALNRNKDGLVTWIARINFRDDGMNKTIDYTKPFVPNENEAIETTVVSYDCRPIQRSDLGLN